MYNENISSNFPNVEITMRIFLSMMVTNASGERSFSKLTFIKNELRNRMTQPRLNNFSLMYTENGILENTNFNDSIHDFATSKCRKHICNVVSVVGVPVLLVLFEMWWCDTLSLVIAKDVASWDFNYG
jgi:hypothetical protein